MRAHGPAPLRRLVAGARLVVLATVVAGAAAAGAQPVRAASIVPQVATFSSAEAYRRVPDATFSLVFTAPVTGLTTGDLLVGGSACSSVGLSGSGQSYAVTLSSCTEGTVGVYLLANSVASADDASVTGPIIGVGSGEVAIDFTNPVSSASIAVAVTTATSVPVAYTASDGTGVGVATVVAYRSASPDMASRVACGPAHAGASGTITCDLPSDGTWYVSTQATDLAGNVEDAPATADDSVVRDLTGPTVTITAKARVTNGNPAYDMVFSEPPLNLSAADLAPYPAPCAPTTPTGSGTTWSFSLTGCPEDTVFVALTPFSVWDALGNFGPTDLAFAGPVTVDRTAPTLTGMALTAASDTGRLHNDLRTSAANLAWTLTFSEPLGVAPGSDAFSYVGTGAAGCATTGLAADGATLTVTASGCGQGTVVPVYTGGGAKDLAGNPDPARVQMPAPVLVDRTAPVLALSTLGWSPTNVPALTFQVTGNEALDCGTISGADGADFDLVGVASVGAITGAGTATCSIPVTSAVGDGASGTTSLAAAAGFAVTDEAGNAATTISGAPLAIGVDRARPAVTIMPTVAATTGTVVGFTITLSKSVPGIDQGQLVLGGTAPGCTLGTLTGGGTSLAIDVTCSGVGTVTLTAPADWLLDLAGNTGPATSVTSPAAVIDQAAPVVTGVTLTPGVGGRTTASSVPVTVRWSATDPGGSGVASAVVERSTDGGTTWTPAAGTFSGASLLTTMPATGSARFRVRATDAAGNAGAFDPASTSPAVRASLVQQTASAVTWKGTWRTARSSSFSGGSLRYATARGSSATYRFTGRSIALVSTRVSARGLADIYVNGTFVKRVDLRGTSGARTVVWQQTWASSVTKTVKVVVRGTSGRPRVDVDAFLVIR